MPKKKKAKDGSTTEFKFDYRYTPKPYFTAPTTVSSSSSPSVQTGSPLGSRSSQQSKAKTTFQSDAWQAQRQRSYGYNSYAKAATQSTSNGTGSVAKASSIEVVSSVDETAAGATQTLSKKDEATIRKVFEEMFKGRVDSSVIDMVLQDVNWNENEALDMLSQIAPEDNSHLYTTLNGPETTVYSGFGAITPDHNLTPTAPTLSYCSSITSLDDYGVEYSRNITQHNLSQVADVLRNGPDDTNDLDRQRRARSRATTPRTLLRNSNLTVKNIALGSTESLESNRSHYSHDPSGITYASASPRHVDTPKKTNFEKTMSLYDITAADDVGLTMTVPKDDTYDTDSIRSDPGTIESLLIPLDHGDIVLEKGTYDMLLNNDDIATESEKTATTAAGTLPHSASISDYSEAISSLTTQLDAVVLPAAYPLSHDERYSDGDSTLTPGSGVGKAALSDCNSPSGAHHLPGATGPAVNGEMESAKPTLSTSYSEKLSTSSKKQYPYDGLLSSGTAVPTAFESARPKKPKVSSKAPPAALDDVTSGLVEAAAAGEKVMFLLRGAPGSGKTFLARMIVERNGAMFNGDEFFIDNDGEYNWQQHELGEAHEWNRNRVAKAVETGMTPLVVDNTHTQAWEMEPYIKLCLMHGYRPVIMEPNTPWRYKAKELCKRTTHHVPYAKIKLMLERFEHTVTLQQLIDRVASTDKQLLPMAEHLKTLSATNKLSRRRQTSKTIKRNKQYDTIEKFKDKKVDELTAPQPRQQHGIEDDENVGETEIMYPSAASLSAVKRSSTIKVLNCDRPMVTDTKSSHTATANDNKSAGQSKTKDRVEDGGILNGVELGTKANDVDSSGTKAKVKVKHRHSSRNDVVRSQTTELVRSEKASDLNSAVNGNSESDKKSAVQEERLLTNSVVANPPLSASSLDKSVSVDTGLSKSRKDQSLPAFLSLDQSEISNMPEVQLGNVGENQRLSTSVTLPRPARADHSEPLLAHSKSLPRPKDKSKSKKSSSKKSTSTSSILNADVAQMGRWLSNDWSAPPYPSVTLPVKSNISSATTSTSSVRSMTSTDTLTSTVNSLANGIVNPVVVASSVTASSLNGVMSSTYAMTSSMGATADPPPPYEEHEGSASAALADDELRYLVKTKDSGTLTEPSDYAMAYKAMQRNQKLPEGWVMLSGHSKEPYPLPASLPHRSTVTYDKGTVIGEGDISLSASDSGEELSSTDKLSRLHSCFPQLSKHQLAEFLELCKGDEMWATNLLLDSNKLSLVRRNKRVTALSIPGLNKRIVRKTKVSKSSLVERFSKAVFPTCLGRHDQPLTQDSISLNLTQEQARNLHAVFGHGTEMPSSLSTGEVMVNVPRWIAHKIYMSMTEDTLTEGVKPQHIIQPTSIRPIRPPRRRKARHTSPRPIQYTQLESSESKMDQTDAATGLNNVTSIASKEGPHSGVDRVIGDDVIGPSESEWTIVDSAPPAYSQEDEELARRLQTEDLMDVIKARQPTPAQKLSLIADEQYARSLMAEEVSSKSQTDMSTKLKRQKLYEMYAGVDKVFLEEVFKSCGYNLDQTLDFLGVHQAREPMASRVATQNGAREGSCSSSEGRYASPSRPQANGVSSRESTPSRDTSAEQEDQWFDVEDYVANADYQDYRREANLHLQQRKELLEKAALANSKRRYDVSAYYSQQAEHHWQKHREANLAAATRIFRNSNSNRSKEEVDLHGLHADEAVNIVSEIVKLTRQEGKRRHLNIITGRGNRSKTGVSRIKQAVEGFLHKNKISYRMENPGMIRVTL